MNHLKQSNITPYTYSDAGYSDLSNHHLLKQGFEIVDGNPPKGAVLYKELSLADKLNALYNTQSAQKRAAFSTLKAAVNLLLEQNDLDAAASLISNLTLEPEDEAIKQQMMKLLQ